MLENKSLLLRALEPEDIDLLFDWENDSNLWHLSNTIKPFSRYVLEQYVLNSHLDIYEHKQLRLMVEQKKTSKNEAVGCIDLFDFDPINLRAGIGLFISEKHRNKGMASQSLDLLIEYAQTKLNLTQLYCSITTNNKASIRVFEKAGFISSGIRLKWVRKDKEWLDEIFYQLVF